MTLVELRYLVAVAEAHSFRRAAEKLFISQPALSLAVARLEDELGVRLLERGKSTVGLTPVGEAVVAQARRVLDEAQAVKTVASQGKDPLAGPFKLGAIHTVAPYLFATLTALVRLQLPSLALGVEEGLTRELQVGLEAGTLDAILIALPFEAPGLVVEALYDEPFDVIMPRGHALARRKTVDATALRRERVLLLHSGHCFANQVVGACPGVAGAAIVLESNSLETVRHMVACGEGISVLPRSAASSPATTALLTTRPFAAPAPSRRIALAARRSFARPEVLTAIAALIRKSLPAGLEPAR